MGDNFLDKKLGFIPNCIKREKTYKQNIIIKRGHIGEKMIWTENS